MGSEAELRLLANVLCGRLEGHPFGDLPETIRADWFQILEESGFSAGRVAGARTGPPR